MRAARTYRAERRNRYFRTEALRREYTWAEWNQPQGGVEARAMVGSALLGQLYHAIGHVARSKYMPHIGNKQRAKAPSHNGEGGRNEP